MTAIQVKDQYGSRLLLDIDAIESVFEVSERSTGIVMRSGREHRAQVSYDELVGVLVDEGYREVVDFTDDPNIEPSEEPSEELSAEDKAALDDLMREGEDRRDFLDGQHEEGTDTSDASHDRLKSTLDRVETAMYELEDAERSGRLSKTVVSEGAWAALGAVHELLTVVRSRL